MSLLSSLSDKCVTDELGENYVELMLMLNNNLEFQENLLNPMKTL